MKFAQWMLVAALGAGAAAVVTAQEPAPTPTEVWVSAEQVDIRAGKGSVFPVVATARQGDKLDVLAKEGSWLKVRIRDKEGYVLESRISLKKVNKDMLAGLGDSEADAADTALASRGLDQNTVDWGAAKGYNEAALEKLIKIRASITPKMWTDFTKEGGVGPDAGQGASKDLGKMSETLTQPNKPRN